MAEGLPYRDFVTVGLLVNCLKLENTTDIPTLGNPPIVPDCWIYVQDPGYKVGRIQVFNNWSPYLVKDVDDTVWVGLEYFCEEGDTFWNMSEEDAVKFAVSELMRMGVIENPEDVIDSTVNASRRRTPPTSTPTIASTRSSTTSTVSATCTAWAATASIATTIWTTPWPPPSRPLTISSPQGDQGECQVVNTDKSSSRGEVVGSCRSIGLID